MDLPLNSTATLTIKVEEAYTAKFIGSGIVNVLATPMLIALMENAAMDAVQEFLPEGYTTVGYKVNIVHQRATPVGEEVSAEAILMKQDDKALFFQVQARDQQGVVGYGEHQRVIIEQKKFMQKFEK